MKLKIKDYIFLAFIIMGLVFFVIQKISNNTDNEEITKDETVQKKIIKINEKSLLVKVVSTENSRFKGLSNIKSIEDNEGMLFLHEQAGTYNYSMREMKFDLDFIFINDNKIVDIAKSISYRYIGTVKGGVVYDKVLEVNADWVRKNDVEIGDLVNLDI